MKHVHSYEIPTIVRSLATEEATFEFLCAARWSGGRFKCPRCRGTRSYARPERLALQCANRRCERVVSVKTGTVMEGSRQPLRTWITAAALMTAHDISAAALQRTLYLRRYAVAHAIVAALRPALSAYDPGPLAGKVLVEEFSVPRAFRAVLSAGEIAEGKVQRRCYRLAPRFGATQVAAFLREAIDLRRAAISVGPTLRRRAKIPGEGASAGILAKLKEPLGDPRLRSSTSKQEDLNAIAFRADFREDMSGAVARLLGVLAPKP